MKSTLVKGLITGGILMAGISGLEYLTNRNLEKRIEIQTKMPQIKTYRNQIPVVQPSLLKYKSRFLNYIRQNYNNFQIPKLTTKEKESLEKEIKEGKWIRYGLCSYGDDEGFRGSYDVFDLEKLIQEPNNKVILTLRDKFHLDYQNVPQRAESARKKLKEILNLARKIDIPTENPSIKDVLFVRENRWEFEDFLRHEKLKGNYEKNPEEFLEKNEFLLDSYRNVYGDFPINMSGKLIQKTISEIETIPIKFLMGLGKKSEEKPFALNNLEFHPWPFWEFVNLNSDFNKIGDFTKKGIINPTNVKEYDAVFLGRRGWNLNLSF